MSPSEEVRSVGDIVDPVKRAKAAHELLLHYQGLAKELHQMRQRAALSVFQQGLMTQRELGEELHISPSSLSPSKKTRLVDYVGGGESTSEAS